MPDAGKRLSDIPTTEAERSIIAMFARNEGDAFTLREAFGLAVAAERARIIPLIEALAPYGPMVDVNEVLAIIEGADDAD